MKYMGSKSRIARHIVPIIQEYIDKNGNGVFVRVLRFKAETGDQRHGAKEP